MLHPTLIGARSCRRPLVSQCGSRPALADAIGPRRAAAVLTGRAIGRGVCGIFILMIRFRFGLYPVDEVSPRSGEQPRLHWFGLTEGWYWIQVGEHELLRYSRLDHPNCYVATAWAHLQPTTR